MKINNNFAETFLDNADINNAKDLRKAIFLLTDGVYNTNDTASFTDSDIMFINKIRNQFGKDQVK